MFGRLKQTCLCSGGFTGLTQSDVVFGVSGCVAQVREENVNQVKCSGRKGQGWRSSRCLWPVQDQGIQRSAQARLLNLMAQEQMASQI